MQRNKLLSILLSLAISFGLWLYVVTFVSSENTQPISNIPIALVGETALAERNLMITDIADDTVNLTLTGSRADLGKVNKDNITLKVDLTKILDPGVHQLEYTPSYPGDVPQNAFVEESRYPATITITVEKKITKEVPVEIDYSGSAPEGFLADTESAVLDYTHVTVTGPSPVVEKIEKARIDVDLEDRVESISENFRYTLCDAEGEPVDVAMVTTNAAEVRLDLPIRRFKEVPLDVTVIYGGGTTEQTAIWELDYETIQVSGSEALLAELESINLGTIDMATITEDTVLTFPINLPEGVINETGVTEANVTITLKGLSTEEFTVQQINVVNVPEGMEYQLLNEQLKVTLRGPTDLINRIQAEDIVVTVDLTGKEAGSFTAKAVITVRGDEFADVGAMGTYSVSVTLSEAEAA